MMYLNLYLCVVVGRAFVCACVFVGGSCVCWFVVLNQFIFL